MGDILKLIGWAVIELLRSRVSLEAEILTLLTLRHQVTVLRRKSPKRLAFSNFDRLVFATLYRFSPRIVNALVIVKPETVIRWHRAGVRLFWSHPRDFQRLRDCGSGCVRTNSKILEFAPHENALLDAALPVFVPHSRDRRLMDDGGRGPPRRSATVSWIRWTQSRFASSLGAKPRRSPK